MRSHLLVFLVFAALHSAPPARAVDHPWPIKDFKVLHRAPVGTPPAEEKVNLSAVDLLTKKAKKIRDRIDEVTTFDDEARENKTKERERKVEAESQDEEFRRNEAAAQAFARLIEGYLADIAQRYEREGFRPPVMTVVEDEGTRKYAVYLYNIDTESAEKLGMYAALENPGLCEGPTRWLSIDREDFTLAGRRQRAAYEKKAEQENLSIENVELDEGTLYKVLAHEVFHAIQGTYDNQYHSLRICGQLREGPFAVIIEGAADGVAEYLTSQKFPQRYAETRNQTPLGGFPYVGPFFYMDERMYQTNSFWRFLAEHYGGLGYMEYLLRRGIKEKPSDDDRIKWLDDALQSYEPIQESLYTLFPRAVTEIYSYVPGRYPKVREGTWISWLAGTRGCQKATVSGDGPAQLVLPQMQPISARCLDIEWAKFAEPVELHIEAIAGSLRVADQIHLGLAKLTTSGKTEYCWDWSRRGGGNAGLDSCLEEKLFVQTGPSPDKFAKWWVLDPQTFQKGARARLIISNIAPPPTPNYPDAPGAQETVKASGVILRYGVARTVSNDEKTLPPARIFNPMSGIIPSGALLSPEPSGIEPRRELALVASLAPVLPPATPQTTDPRELLYGIQKKSALDPGIQTNMASFQIGEPGEKRYLVSPAERYDLGYTGPFRGVVSREPGEAASSPDLGEVPVGSMYCPDGQKGPQVIGQVLESNELSLRIRIQTDLCKVNMQWAIKEIPSGGPGGPGVKIKTVDLGVPPFPVADRLDAEIILPFGWRYFSESAPKDIVTPGVEIYMARFGNRMEGVQALQGIPNTFSGGGAPGGLGAGAGGNSDSQGCSEPWVWTGTCTCCCGELARIRDLRKRGNELNAAEKKEEKEVEMCSLPCVQQYIQCRMKERK